mmetsp:Transcript_33815/g.74188  ORF Transcript_33815/g.74188 Transcript_33815/m.74188 type:complete len:143 (+) Transcript_33815:1602-2030(+)
MRTRCLAKMNDQTESITGPSEEEYRKVFKQLESTFSRCDEELDTDEFIALGEQAKKLPTNVFEEFSHCCHIPILGTILKFSDRSRSEALQFADDLIALMDRELRRSAEKRPEKLRALIADNAPYSGSNNVKHHSHESNLMNE